MSFVWVMCMVLLWLSSTSPELDEWVVTPRGGLFLFFLIMAICSSLSERTDSLENRVKELEGK